MIRAGVFGSGNETAVSYHQHLQCFIWNGVSLSEFVATSQMMEARSFCTSQNKEASLSTFTSLADLMNSVEAGQNSLAG